MKFSSVNHEDRWAFLISVGVHALLVLFAVFYTMQANENKRRAYIEVTLGQFSSGTAAEFSREKNEEVATRPEPVEAEQTEQQAEQAEAPEPQQSATDETSKQVNLPEQQEEVDEQEVKTPDTEKVDPNKQKADQQQEQQQVTTTIQEDEDITEGEKTSGDKRGTTGNVNVDQGSGQDPTKAAPYELNWEGDFEREPMVRPLPDYNAQVEAEIRVRFQVKPNGTVGQVIPLKKMNPELEKEIYRTLRSWRFDRLPSGMPQQAQWGTITFRFVLD